MWIASCAAACCATCTCQACMSLFSGISRQSARLTYFLVFTASLLLSLFLRDFAGQAIHYLSWFGFDLASFLPPEPWWRTQAVLRVSFSGALFFGGLALVLLRTRDKSDMRHAWHQGAWAPKMILWLASLVVAFILPDKVVELYAYLAQAGALLFLLLQVIILLDFVYSWNEAWVEFDEYKWYMGLLIVTVVCYLASLIACSLLFVWFNPSGVTLSCDFNFAVISCTMLLIAVFTALALHPLVNGSLMPSAFLSAYCSYLAWSALTSEPRDYECNGLASHFVSLSSSRLVVGLIATVLSVGYSALRTGSSSSLLAGGSSAEGYEALSSSHEDVDEKDGSSSGPVPYVYSFFHLVFVLASMYSAMLLTGWSTEQNEEGIAIVNVGWPSVHVKLFTLGATAALYIWSLVAPILLPDREFA